MTRGKGGPVSYSVESVFGASAGIEGLAGLAIVVVAIYGLIRIRPPIKTREHNNHNNAISFLWFYAVSLALFLSYMLTMTSYAIYAFFYSPQSYDVYDVWTILLHARRLEPVGRFFRRVGAALCAVMISEITASCCGRWGGYDTVAMEDQQGHNRHGRILRCGSVQQFSRFTIFLSSITATILALVSDCVLSARSANVDTNPRLDDQFTNTSPIVTALGATVILLLILGSGAATWMTAMVSREINTNLREDRRRKKASSLLFGAALLLLIVRLWSIAELTLVLRRQELSTNNLAWFYLADAFMDRWATFLVVLVVYFVGLRLR